jgi:DNA-directed RNA polymerase specialized sigma24 family protein
MTSSPTTEMIEDVIAGLPIQGRIILRLLLIQYLDVTHEEILYMVADRPDPRCVSGKKPVTTMTQESIAAMSERRSEYRRHARLRRERTWLQCIALNNQAHMASALATRAAALLTARGVPSATIDRLTAQARSAVPSTTLRLLEEGWDKNEIPAEDYQTHRLVIEMQTQRRFAERFKKRLDLAQREQLTSDRTILSDHEIGHIWGIPAGTLAARKVKFLAQYLAMLQAKCSGAAVGPGTSLSLDLWKETMQVLARTPIERSIATYDGLESTESALLEKLAAYALIRIPEASENKFWNSLVSGASSNAMHSETTRTLFGLQRLVSIQKDLDAGDEALDEELLTRTAPIPKEPEAPALQNEPSPSGLTELQQHILNNFVGEDISGRASDKW